MPRDGDGREAPTRRECVRYGGTIVDGCLLAGHPNEGASETASTAARTPEVPESGQSFGRRDIANAVRGADRA